MSSSMASTDVLRRTPVQARSRKRYDAMVLAAAAKFAEHGFEATTMDNIAQATPTSIGSVYQFFGGKQDLFVAVADLRIERSRQLFERLHSLDVLPKSWRKLLQTVVSGYVFFHDNDVCFRAIVRNLQMLPLFEQKERKLQQELVEHSAKVLRHYGRHIDEPRSEQIAMAVHQILSVGLITSSLNGDYGTQRMSEIQVVLERYLAVELDDPTHGGQDPIL